MNTSQTLNIDLRRRAAFKTLYGVVDQDSLMTALWMLEERNQAADRITFINFFAVIAELLNIESNIIKTLFIRLKQNINLPDIDLPLDPMPEMLRFRGEDYQQQQSKNITNNKKVRPEMIVFVALLSKIASEAGYPKAKGYKVFRKYFLAELKNADLKKHNREQLCNWVDELNLKVFKKNTNKEEISIAMQCVLTALDSAHGPSLAKIIANISIEHTSKLAAAKTCSPASLL